MNRRRLRFPPTTLRGDDMTVMRDHSKRPLVNDALVEETLQIKIDCFDFAIRLFSYFAEAV